MISTRQYSGYYRTFYGQLFICTSFKGIITTRNIKLIRAWVTLEHLFVFMARNTTKSHLHINFSWLFSSKFATLAILCAVTCTSCCTFTWAEVSVYWLLIATKHFLLCWWHKVFEAGRYESHSPLTLTNCIFFRINLNQDKELVLDEE